MADRNENSTVDFLMDLKDIFQQTTKDIEALSLGIHTIEKITYYSAIEYFIKERPTKESIKCGVMLKQKHSHGVYIFTQAYIDENNNIVYKQNGQPYGRRVLVKQFDEELLQKFGSSNLIIVQ